MTPNSYKDPFWADLAEQAAQKVGLPSGFLSSIILNGEKSNANQVSEAGAKTPFQIIPSTRKLILDKYGIDPYLNPQNAALGAAYIAKEGLDRNNGDIKLAAAEYHGGPDRKNWGPRTAAYADRVASGVQPPFDVVKVYQAYQSGKMNPQQKAEFEADVSSGVLKLPAGLSLSTQPAQANQATQTNQPFQVNEKIVSAYNEGRMTPQQKADFEADLKEGRIALPAGATLTGPKQEPSTIAKIADVFTGSLRETPETKALPDYAGMPELNQMSMASFKTGLGTMFANTDEMVNIIKAQNPNVQIRKDANGNYILKSGIDNQEYVVKPGLQLSDIPRALGAAAAFAPAGAATSLIGAGLGSAATQGAIELTQAATGGEVNPGDIAIAGALPPVVMGVGRAITEAAKRAPQVAQTATETAQNLFQRGQQAVGMTPQAGSTAGGSVGAAGLEKAALRQNLANELPVPVPLTKGQATRDFAQQQFERETAKAPDVGAPLRQRFETQNDLIQKNFDAFVDLTGAELGDLRSTGQSVERALRQRAAADKARIRVAYKNAEKAGELEAPVTLDGAVNFINENQAFSTTAPILSSAKNFAVKTGVATVDDAGNLVAQPVTLKVAEEFRKAINKYGFGEPTNYGPSISIKSAIDDATAGVGGSLYKEARALRTRYAQNYENIGIARDLLATKKGTTDRKIALEDVFKKSILDGSRDDVQQIRRLLQTQGEEGQQAWRELQGATVRDIRDKVFSNAALDSQGNQIPSFAKFNSAIRGLDADGKLDYIFGKKGAEQLRTLNEVTGTVVTVPPGSVNTSNTAAVLSSAIDLMLTGTSGVPLPVANGLRYISKNIRDRKIKGRVEQALRGIEPAKTGNK